MYASPSFVSVVTSRMPLANCSDDILSFSTEILVSSVCDISRRSSSLPVTSRVWVAFAVFRNNAKDSTIHICLHII